VFSHEPHTVSDEIYHAQDLFQLLPILGLYFGSDSPWVSAILMPIFWFMASREKISSAPLLVELTWHTNT